MMILISGQPGNGKTLRALAEMLAEQQRNLASNKLPEGSKGWEPLRRFFTNIAGATTEENPEAFPWVEKLPEHNDWRALPDGSYVIYDEAHADGATEGLERYGLLFPGTGKPGEASDPRIKAMATHRHRGFDLVFVTQWPNKVHHTLRTLVGKHVHMNRAMGMERAGVLSWTRVQTNPYDEKEREKAEEEIWAYPTGLYRRYRSATSHSSAYKFKVPKKVWGALSMLVMSLLVAWGLWLFVFKPDPKQPTQERQAAPVAGASAAAPGGLPVAYTTLTPESLEPEPQGTGAYASLQSPTVPGIAGCIDSNRGCRCFGRDGDLIDQPQDECRALVDKGFPINLFAVGGSGSRAGVVNSERGAGGTPAAMNADAFAFSPGAIIGAGGLGAAPAAQPEASNLAP